MYRLVHLPRNSKYRVPVLFCAIALCCFALLALNSDRALSEDIQGPVEILPVGAPVLIKLDGRELVIPSGYFNLQPVLYIFGFERRLISFSFSMPSMRLRIAHPMGSIFSEAHKIDRVLGSDEYIVTVSMLLFEDFTKPIAEPMAKYIVKPTLEFERSVEQMAFAFQQCDPKGSWSEEWGLRRFAILPRCQKFVESTFYLLPANEKYDLMMRCDVTRSSSAEEICRVSVYVPNSNLFFRFSIRGSKRGSYLLATDAVLNFIDNWSVAKK